MDERNPSSQSWLSGARRSLQEYATRARRRGWAVIVSGIGGVLGLISLTVAPPRRGPLVHTWLWVGLLVGGAMVAQFLAFHDVRLERDAVRQEMQRRFDSLRYCFQLSTLSGGPVVAIREGGTELETGYKFSLHFANASAEAMWYQVESLAISIGQYGPEVAPFESTTGIILPGREGQFGYHWIPAPAEPVARAGCGEYVVLYGHPSGGTRFRTRHKFKIAWAADPSGVLPAFATVGEISHELVSDGPL